MHDEYCTAWWNQGAFLYLYNGIHAQDGLFSSVICFDPIPDEFLYWYTY
jgi:hypothetical protein